MSKFRNLINSFKHGEISEGLVGRHDIEERKHGLKLLQNFIPKLEGGVFRRPGSQLVPLDYDLNDASNGLYAIPFVFNKSTGYIITLNLDAPTLTTFFRIVKSDGTDITHIYQANASQLPVAAMTGVGAFKDDPYGFDYIQIADVMIITHSSGKMPPLVVARISDDEFEVGTYLDSGWAHFTGIQNVDPVLRTPFKDANTTSVTMLPGATSGTTTLTASTAYFKSPGDIGRLVKVVQGANTGVARIDSLVTTSIANITILVNFGAATASTDFSLGYFAYGSTTTPEGPYPKTVTVFQQRLIFGGTNEDLDLLATSKTGNIFLLMQERLAQDSSTDASGLGYFGTNLTTDPFTSKPATSEVNPIQWISASLQLEVGTLGGELTATLEIQESFSFLSFKEQSSFGGSDVKPVRIAGSTIFISQDGKHLREFRFNEENGSYLSNNISILNNEIIYNNVIANRHAIVIEQLTYQRSINTVWALTSAHELIGLTYDRYMSVVAWHRHNLGADVLSIASIPNAQGTGDDLYLIMRRGTTPTIEKISSPFNENSIELSSMDFKAFPYFYDMASKQAIVTEDGSSIDIEISNYDSVAAPTNVIIDPGEPSDFYKTFPDLSKVQYLVNGTEGPIGGLVDGAYYYISYVDYFDMYKIAVADTLAHAISGTFIELTDPKPPFVATHKFVLVALNSVYTAKYLERDFQIRIGTNDYTLSVGSQVSDIFTAIPDETEYALYGLEYESILQTMKQNFGASFGDAHNSVQRVNEIAVDFFKSYFAQYGRDLNKLYMINSLSLDAEYTGEIVLKMPGTYKHGDEVILYTKKPYPLSISNITLKGVSYDG